MIKRADAETKTAVDLIAAVAVVRTDGLPDGDEAVGGRPPLGLEVVGPGGLEEPRPVPPRLLPLLRVRGEQGYASPKGLLQKAREDRDAVLDLSQDYVLTLREAKSSKERAYKTVRGFFLHNRLELPRDPSFRIKGDRAPVTGRPAVDDVRAIIRAAKLKYRAVFLCMLQGGMGQAELQYFNLHRWSLAEPQLRQGKHPIRVECPREERATRSPTIPS